MPKKNIEYSKTVIYKIVCRDVNIKDIYVGTTTDFTRKKSYHKNNCMKPESPYYNLKVYQFIRENGGWKNFIMVEIEKFPCKDSYEAAARE